MATGGSAREWLSMGEPLRLNNLFQCTPSKSQIQRMWPTLAALLDEAMLQYGAAMI
ncbi:hypothetical protein M408DRAFT_331382 [Serendipita vermifera MAFF 305830]|uniref:Uncharacterized protein n=1 Tax=Serendipita vermifera MAFF 305830 TaxID=933852 RepID=A0A0C2WF59_SERVB|nr:hypothetical protein M408DRAFT_331382 [Serendipita vermifera MAFF 305830]